MWTQPVQIIDVDANRGQVGREFCRIKTSDGKAYATTDQRIMGHAERAKADGRKVIVQHYGGWYYRDIVSLEDAP